jgi:hypothetical protein
MLELFWLNIVLIILATGEKLLSLRGLVALAGAAEAGLAPAGFLAAGAVGPVRLRVAGVLLLLAGGEERGIWIITKRYVGDQRLLQVVVQPLQQQQP